MSIIAQAKEHLKDRLDPQHVERVMAFTAGYLGDPLPAELEGDSQLRDDWEKGVKAHQKELADEEEMRRAHH